ncbi:hypothetical protein CDV31_006061 [Fusarium ambrosium]|uniref:uS12 prolyl 3,4-dihydroxylase n=1 Tax=Fusarium ambrosium TaxID=131363 RepID=A0A428UFA3_9HYPO|nr:hypothetical protein CDV31_006061 [Fusarium ambrosium]
MKRKAGSRAHASAAISKKPKPSLSTEVAKERFRAGLFDKDVLDSYTTQYAESAPYKHAVINGLVNDELLRSVRAEIKANVEFTPKETDIYKIHQSGDLANLDGLDDESLSKLPSLLKLRDAIYSESFRDYVSHITACGPLSGRKTDMAINIYTPGCYLLCHDDVIGSRRVSYILYLVDPDNSWKPEWGGALRLFPIQELKDKDGEVAKTPLPDVTKVIPPAWNQLSFFAVQPGESFHDVEEVYHAATKKQLEKDGGRVRMAISGWFHIPQLGEEGYIEGEEERNAKNSGLMQLQGNPAQYDMPQPQVIKVDSSQSGQEGFDEADLEFLLKYLSPTYLVPDTLDQISSHFNEVFEITLTDILCKKFAKRLRDYVEAEEKKPTPEDTPTIEKTSSWRVAKPPHKYRYLYQQPSGPDQLRTSQEESPITELLDIFLPSRQFRQWLQMATNTTIESADLLARRFRRGLDYTLATGHEGKARVEINLGFTPTPGWGDDEEEEEEKEETKKNDKEAKTNGKDKGKAVEKDEPAPKEADEVGGQEIFMSGDDDADEDAAVYKTGSDDDNILFFQAAAWNKMTIVLRDSGALKFIKYISKSAKGDRWDISGAFEIEEQDDSDDEMADAGEGPAPDEESEEEFQGFSPDAAQSDSD